MWLIGILILIALLIPIMSIMIDSPVGRALGRRMEGPVPADTDVVELGKKVELLEGEVDDLMRMVQGLQDETAFLQKLLEDAPPRTQLPPPPS